MDETYTQAYRELYEKHWWWRAREELVWQTLQQLGAGGGTERILDVGCGDGLFLERLSELGEVEGLEPLAQVSQDRSRFTIHRCPFDASFQPEHPFSLITMLDVLEHLEDRPSALHHVQRLLRPGGVLLLTVPAFQSLWTGHDDINHHHVRYTEASLATEVRAAGLGVEGSRYFFHWGAAAKLAVRLKERLRPATPQPERLPSPRINRLLLALSRAERRALGRRSLPFGSSLMLVARRPDTLTE